MIVRIYLAFLIFFNSLSAIAGGTSFMWKLSPQPPISPTRNWECQNYAESVTKYNLEISEAHSECLNESKGGNRSCSNQSCCTQKGCQSLHDELNDNSRNENVNECWNKLNENKKSQQRYDKLISEVRSAYPTVNLSAAKNATSPYSIYNFARKPSMLKASNMLAKQAAAQQVSMYFQAMNMFNRELSKFSDKKYRTYTDKEVTSTTKLLLSCGNISTAVAAAKCMSKVKSYPDQKDAIELLDSFDFDD